jgi:hypothetical protein
MFMRLRAYTYNMSPAVPRIGVGRTAEPTMTITGTITMTMAMTMAAP